MIYLAIVVGCVIGALIGIVEGILCSFVLLYVSSVINTTAPYVNESKYSGIILNNSILINDLRNKLTDNKEKSLKEVKKYLNSNKKTKEKRKMTAGIHQAG